jgi:hypothetical protein
MNYREFMGFDKNKKIKKPTKISTPPKKNDIIESIKGEIKEWTHKPPTEKRWSGAYKRKDGLTEFESRGGKDSDTIKEENESTWTIVYKGLLAGFRKGKDKRLDVVAKAVGFLIKTEFGVGAKNDFINAFKKNI